MTEINYAELREKIDSVAPDEMAKVLADAGFVRVEFDQESHPAVTYDELDETSKIGFAFLDTTYNLLREGAVRTTLAAIREAAVASGVDFQSDEELFEEARRSGIEGAPTSYRDLAPHSRHAMMHLHEAFGVLVGQAEDDAAEGLGIAFAEKEGGE